MAPVARNGKIRAMKIVIADDQPIVISGFRSLYRNRKDVQIYNAASIVTAFRVVQTVCPDVVIVGNDLSDGSGLKLIRNLANQGATKGLLFYSNVIKPELALSAIQCGARGFVAKSADTKTLRKAVSAVARGDTWLDEQLMQQMAFARIQMRPSPASLTDREKEVMTRLAAGHKITEIADDLSLSRNTITKIVAALRSRLNARTPMEFLCKAIELGVL